MVNVTLSDGQALDLLAGKQGHVACVVKPFTKQDMMPRKNIGLSWTGVGETREESYFQQ